MGNRLYGANGVDVDAKLVERVCDKCDAPYVGWEDGTMTIKGEMHISGLCASCQFKKSNTSNTILENCDLSSLGTK